MGQLGRKVGVVFAVMLAAAWGTASAATPTLVSYATGSWACTLTATANGHTVTLKPTGTVAATSATTGTVAITIPAPFHTEKLSGQWALDGHDLTVQWSKRSQGTTEAKPVSLATKQFRIKSGKPGSAKWSAVTVDRTSRSVTFDFPLDPSRPSGPQGTMTCRKA